MLAFELTSKGLEHAPRAHRIIPALTIASCSVALASSIAVNASCGVASWRRVVFLAVSFIGGSFRGKHRDLSIGAGGTATFKFQQRTGRSQRKRGCVSSLAPHCNAFVSCIASASAAQVSLAARRKAVGLPAGKVSLTGPGTTGPALATMLLEHLRR